MTGHPPPARTPHVPSRQPLPPAAHTAPAAPASTAASAADADGPATPGGPQGLLEAIGPATDEIAGTAEEHSVVERLLADVLASPAGDALADVAYRTVDSPLGPLLLAATPAGLVRLAYGVQGHDRVLEDLAARISPRVVHLPKRLDAVATELDEYFRGARPHFDIPVDLQLVHGFTRAVLEQVCTIPYAHSAGYAAIAAAAGSAGAARAVGTACSKNPVPIVVPCHRVLRSDGSLGGYVGGPDAKRFLLDVESAAGAAGRSQSAGGAPGPSPEAPPEPASAAPRATEDGGEDALP